MFKKYIFEVFSISSDAYQFRPEYEYRIVLACIFTAEYITGLNRTTP